MTAQGNDETHLPYGDDAGFDDTPVLLKNAELVVSPVVTGLAPLEPPTVEPNVPWPGMAMRCRDAERDGGLVADSEKAGGDVVCGGSSEEPSEVRGDTPLEELGDVCAATAAAIEPSAPSTDAR